MDQRKKVTSSKPQITIVIGTLNRPQVILTLLNQLKKLKKPSIEVLVIDQSIDEDYKTLKTKFPDMSNFKLVHFETPNTCKYLNYGWRHAKADIVLYLDDDVTVADRTVSAHLNQYRDLRTKAVAGRVINDGEAISKDDKVGRVFWYGASFAKNFTYEKKAIVEFPYGCNMSFRKSALAQLGGFDEKLAPPMYAFNEIDIGVRINKVWKNSLIFLPQALVYHHQYKSGGTRNNFTLEEVMKGNNFNYGYFVGKNYNAFENLIFFVRRFSYQLLKESRSIKEIFKGFSYAKKMKKK